MTENNQKNDTIIHLTAGATAGTVGAIVTCPLEVIKTRLQSSRSFLRPVLPSTPTSSCNIEILGPGNRRKLYAGILQPRPLPYGYNGIRRIMAISNCRMIQVSKQPTGILQCLKHVVRKEGARALFKGLGPNIIGVAPSRAIYFCTYSQTKVLLNNNENLSPDTPIVHVLSAASAGFVSSTLTNPIWFVKTRLQLDFNSKVQMTIRDCVRRVYSEGGIFAFYKGITASYFGICETMVHFVIYEYVKAKLVEIHSHEKENKTRDFFEFMLAGAISKTFASCIAYPHEVARTRLREEGSRYNGFLPTIKTVYLEEGRQGIYRGLATQLVRQIPNTAIMMATYEAVVYMLKKYFG